MKCEQIIHLSFTEHKTFRIPYELLPNVIGAALQMLKHSREAMSSGQRSGPLCSRLGSGHLRDL